MPAPVLGDEALAKAPGSLGERHPKTTTRDRHNILAPLHDADVKKISSSRRRGRYGVPITLSRWTFTPTGLRAPSPSER